MANQLRYFLSHKRTNLEVTHRFEFACAEHAVKKFFDAGGDIIRSEKKRRPISLNTWFKRFANLRYEKVELPARFFVGTELEGKLLGLPTKHLPRQFLAGYHSAIMR